MRNITPQQKEFTASVFVLTKEHPKKVLLVHHKKMDTWFQPGGHIEMFENPIEAAVREVREETGVDISFLLKEIKPIDTYAKELPVPKFFMEERIPAHKEQPEHFHLDFFYVAEVPEQSLQVNERESHNIGWFTKAEAEKLGLLKNTQILLDRLFSELPF